VWAARIAGYCQTLTDAEEPVMLKTALAELGISWKVLRDCYPDLARLLQTTIRACQQQQRAARLAAQLAQIDAAADRLHTRGVRLSQRAILLEAEMSLHSGANMILRQRLQHWVGDFPWNE
jgi:methylphosphotriester-DNA--protein-cysteine methyltransferase